MRLINRNPGKVLAAAPSDKLLPALSTIGKTTERLFTQLDKRSGKVLLWHDTWASLKPLPLGVAISVALATIFGLLIGLLLHVRTALAGFVAVISMIPPLAILPILFIVFGLGELSKVVLIIIGFLPFLIRDLSDRVLEIPREMIVKAETLGASSLTLALRVALPQMMPRRIGAIRLSLGPAWLFLIAADRELGYRISVVRRYLTMDVILSYVTWITFLAFMMVFAPRRISRRAFPWAETAL